MLNKEKYAKEIMDLALKHDVVALVDGKVCSCSEIGCGECFFYKTKPADCDKKFIEWANSEYKEKEIDWSKVPVDTPIVIDEENGGGRYNRHFACFKDNMIYAWSEGKTSHTTNCATHCDYAEIAEGVDCSEWYKD